MIKLTFAAVEKIEIRRVVRVVEGARLESVYTSKGYRGFESLTLRSFNKKFFASETGVASLALPVSGI